MSEFMSGTSAKAHLLELLLEPLKGCKGLYNYKQDLMKQIMEMPDLKVREYLDYHKRCNASGSVASSTYSGRFSTARCMKRFTSGIGQPSRCSDSAM